MKQEITKKLEKILEKENKRLHDDAILTSFEQASVEFEKLVKSGIVKKRGYNLMTIEKKHLHQFSMNSNF